MQIEEWRSVKYFEGYYSVSSFGRVRSETRFVPILVKGKEHRRKLYGQFLKLKKDRYGYLTVTLCRGTDSIYATVHRLVARAFLDSPTPGRDHVNHINMIKTDNRVSNLEWNTAIENYQNFRRLGKQDFARGSQLPQAKLLESDVLRILKMGKEGTRVALIAREFSINVASVYYILAGKTWKHVTRPD